MTIEPLRNIESFVTGPRIVKRDSTRRAMART
jgi:hypothetical protein